MYSSTPSTHSLDLEHCSQMQCNFKNPKGKIDGIMCGGGGDYCASDQWCTNPLNEKLSYWTNGSNIGYPNCYSNGKLYYHMIEPIFL